MSYRSLQPYDPPAWAKGLKIRPTSRTVLAQQPTPIHEWAVPGVPSGFQLYVKREDLTGSTLTGNKVRKLEFILADALSQGCDTIVTQGGLQSNHCRTTAVAAREFGLSTHILVVGEDEGAPGNVGCSGNLLLDRLCATTIVVVAPSLQAYGSLEEVVGAFKLAEGKYMEKLRSEGKHPYFIPTGGSSHIGTWGYIEGFKEMMEQGVLDRFDDIVLAAGSSGGTACGLAIANYLTGSKLKIHGVAVAPYLEYTYSQMSEHLKALGINGVSPSDIVDLFDGCSSGYGKSTREELELLLEVSTQTGVVLDTTFTVKALRGLLSEMKKNPGRFKGRRILFIHTGGIHSLFSGKLDEIVKETEATNQVYNFHDLIKKS